jgi:outer membrane immunogenic protein
MAARGLRTIGSDTMDRASPRAAALLIAAFVISGAASVLPALSADLGGGPAVSPEPYEHRAPAELGRWDGLYFGINYAYATGWTAVAGTSGAFDLSTSGSMGTAFAGYNWQLGRAVAGLEADIGFGGLSGSENDVSADLNSLGSLRGRLGYLLTPDFLVYGTAGFAWANFDFEAAGDTQSDTLLGYQVGAGAELMFSDPWSLKLEYVYTDLDAATLSHNGVSNTYEPDFHTIRAGLSFNF